MSRRRDVASRRDDNTYPAVTSDEGGDRKPDLVSCVGRQNWPRVHSGCGRRAAGVSEPRAWEWFAMAGSKRLLLEARSSFKISRVGLLSKERQLRTIKTVVAAAAVERSQDAETRWCRGVRI